MRTFKTLVVVALLTPLLAPGFPAVSQDCATPRDVEDIVGRHEQNVFNELRGISDRVGRDVAERVERILSGKFENITTILENEIVFQLESIKSDTSLIPGGIEELRQFVNDKVNELELSIRDEVDRAVSEELRQIKQRQETLMDQNARIEESLKRIKSEMGIDDESQQEEE